MQFKMLQAVAMILGGRRSQSDNTIDHDSKARRGKARSRRWKISIVLSTMLAAVFVAAVSAEAQQADEPSLAISVGEDRTVRISWPESSVPYVLEETESLELGSWRATGEIPTVRDGLLSVSQPAPPAMRFYRLRSSEATPSSEPSLVVSVNPDKSVSISWRKSPVAYLLEETESLQSGGWRPTTEPAILRNNWFYVTQSNPPATRFYRLRSVLRKPSFTLVNQIPLDGANDVGVTVHPKISFSEPVDPGSLTAETFFATAAGVKLEANIVSANDGSFAWLFFKSAMPGGTQVLVTVDGAGIFSAADRLPLDADGDGQPGGVRDVRFTTVSLAGLPGTSLTGMVLDPGPDLIPRTLDDVLPGADGVVQTADDILLLPIAGVRVFLLGRENQSIVTGINGRFHFDSVPAGNVKIVIDGRSASTAPPGSYFPEMVMDANMVAGRQNFSMMGMPEVYLPRLARTILQDIDTTKATVVVTKSEGAQGLTEQQRQLLTIEVQPGSLIGADGSPLTSGQVGISTVPPELVRDMLPPGVLQHTFDITVQAPGIEAFSTPAPMTFPNVFNAAPGTKLNFLSFDHTTGRLVIEGTATVSADGLSVSTDPGTGITHPGWHGLTPPGGPNDPPCNPTAPHDVDVAPLPVTSGIQNHFFSKFDSTKFSFSIGNAAPKLVSADNDPCSKENFRATPLVVDIKIEGNEKADFFLKGLEPEKLKQFVLLPGQQQTISWNLNPLQSEGRPDFKKLEKDQIYVAKVTIQGWQSNKPGKPLLHEEIYIALFLDAADANHDDGILSIASTAADGRDGVVRRRPLEVHGVPIHLETSDPTHFPAVTQAKEVLFDPNSVGKDLGAMLRLLTVDRKLIGELGLLGDGVMEEYHYDKSRIRFLLQSAAEGSVNGVTDAQKSFLTAPGAIDRIITNVANKVEQYLKPYAAGLRAADSPPKNGISFPVYDSLDATKPLKPGTLAQSLDLDFCRTKLGCDENETLASFLRESVGWSEAEKGYQLSKRLNNNTIGTVELYIDKFLTDKKPDGQPYITTEAELTDRIAKVIPHEIGHSLGLMHTMITDLNNAPFKWAIGADNQPLPGYKEDIMAQGKPVAAPAFLATKPALQMALGLNYNKSDIAKALGYFAAVFKGATAYGQLDGFAPEDDLNFIEILPEEEGVLLIYGPGEGNEVVSSFDFGPVAYRKDGADALTVPFTLNNIGRKDITLLSVEVEGDDTGSFRLGSLLPPGTEIPAHDSITVMVELKPTESGELSGSLHVEHDGETGSEDVELTGIGLSPDADISVSVSANNVGASIPGNALNLPEYLLVENRGEQSLSISAITATGPFSITGLVSIPSAVNPLVIQPGQSVSLNLKFLPDRNGLQRGGIQFASNDPDAPFYKVDLSGTGTTLNPLDNLDYGNDFVSIESPDFPSVPILRTKSDANGNFSFFLPANQAYHAVIFDPVSGMVAHLVGRTPPSGENTQLGVPVFSASTAPDSDGDGLPDDAELTIGTNLHKPDTDGDGLDDFAAVLQGVDPLGGRAAVTGIVAQVPIADARDVDVVSNDGGKSALAYVAAGAEGLVIVDVSRATQPAVVSKIVLRGQSLSVSIDTLWQVAAVGADTHVHLVDVSNPESPRLIKSIQVNAPSPVVTVDGYAYYEANYGTLYALKTDTGEIAREIALPGNYLKSLVGEGDFLYAMDFNGLLRVIEIHGADMVVRGSIQVAGGPGQLVVVNGIAYIPLLGQGGGGYGTLDVRDPNKPLLLAGASVPAGGSSPATSLVVSGSGFGLLIGNAAGGGGNAADLMNIADPTNTYSFITRFSLPNPPFAGMIASGSAFIADGPAGLLVLNYQGLDVAGNAPVASLTGVFAQSSTSTPITEIVEGSRFLIQATIADDAQLRSVELLINGQPVSGSISVPWNLAGFAPSIAGSGTSFTVQVRATDTGGNSGVSPPVVIQLLPDTTPPVLLHSDLAEGEAKLRGFDSIVFNFSEPMASTGLIPANFELIHENGQVFHPIGFALRNFNKQGTVKFNAMDLPGNYQFVIRPAGFTDGAGNPLSMEDVITRFSVLTYSIRWDNPVAATADELGSRWFTEANWFPKRVPGSKDWVRIDVPDPNLMVHLKGRLYGLPVPLRETVRVRSLISNAALDFFWIDLQADEGLQMDNKLNIVGSTFRDMSVIAESEIIVAASSYYPPIGGPILFDNVTLKGDFGFSGAMTLGVINNLTLEGDVYDRSPPGVRAVLETTRDTILHGPGTFHDISLFLARAIGDDVNRVGATVTIDEDVTLRGSFDIGMVGPSSKVINRGQLLADKPRPFDSGRYYTRFQMYDANQSLINEGSIVVSNSFRLLIGGAFNTKFINRGVLQAADTGFLWLAAPMTSANIRCEAGGTVQLNGGQNEPWTTDAGQISELSGPGLWLAAGQAFQGGSLRMTDGAVLEGAPIFNNVISFDGELHNYDWSTRSRELPTYVTAYGGSVTVRSSLTLNGLIVFHRPSDLEYGGRLWMLGSESRLDGNGHVEFENGHRFNQVFVSNGDLGGFLTIGPNISIHGKALTLGNVQGNSNQPPTIVNQGLITTQAGDFLNLAAFDFTNAGVIHIASNNVVTTYFNFIQSPTGKLEFDLAGTTPGTTHGQLKIGGQATLGGEVNLLPLAPYSLSNGDAFELLNFQSRTGEFSKIGSPALPAGLKLSRDYQPKRFVLQAQP